MKVLVAGSWSEKDGDYSVLFGSISVPATLVQHGLLRCYAPGLMCSMLAPGVGGSQLVPK